MISTDNLNFVPKSTMTPLPEFPCLIIVILFYFRVLIDLCFNYSKTCLTPPLKIDYTLLSPYLCFISILFRFVLLQGDDTSTKIVSEYDQEIPQSQTADNPNATARKSISAITRHQEGQIQQSNQLSLPTQDDCNTRMDIK